MPDERVLERWFERSMEALDALTKQVARAAWAIESLALSKQSGVQDEPCAACGSQVVLTAYDKCMACRHPLPKRPEEIDYHG